MLLAAVVEVLLRADMPWRPAALGVAVVLSFAVLRRRTDPLLAVAAGFGALLVLDLTALVVGAAPFSLYAGAAVLLLVYALFRHGTSRQAVAGSPLVVAVWALATATDPSGLTDAVGGLVVLVLAAVLGLAVRYRHLARLRLLEQVRLQERDVLARDLHDTVAHHVSAIAVQAQAGQLLARAGDLDRAREALSVIEAEASRALREMRSIVATLRRDDAGRRPDERHGLEALEALGGPGDRSERDPGPRSRPPRVVVEQRGDLDAVHPAVQAALYRVAQEAVTNARRHARHATLVEVVVDDTGPGVRLSVCDDGEAPATVPRTPGYGLLGMEERVTLLGGSFQAGPGPDGWAVRATLPRRGAPA